jgi:hypothetical protein
MKKLKTLFETERTETYHVVNKLRDGLDWIFTNVCHISQKIDGTSCAIIESELYKRYDVKKGKTPPTNAIECQEADPISGHWPHWVPITSNDKYHLEAFNKLSNKIDGTYELIGPKINGNPENLGEHILELHGSREVVDISYNEENIFDKIREYLQPRDIEGLIFKNTLTGDMFKIRKSDYNLPRK